MSRMMKASPGGIGKKVANLNQSAADNASMFMTEPPSAIKVQQNAKGPMSNAYGGYNTYQMSSGLRASGF